MSQDDPHPVDVHVGAKIRTRRKELGLSQQALAEACGVSFQQIQKYERGANRLSCSVLVMAAAALQAPPGYFVDDAPGAPQELRAGDGWGEAARIVATVTGALEALRCLDAVRAPSRHHLLAMLQMAAGRFVEPGKDSLAA